MLTAIQIFKNNDFGDIRGGIDPVKGPWIVLKDLCECLDIANYRNVAARLLDNEKGVRILGTPGGNQEMIVAYEPGIYRTIMRSNKPEAVQFQIWIANEVLPSIRKTGSYHIGQTTGLSCDGQSDQYPALRAEGKAVRRGLTDILKEHGATEPYHYSNFTNTEYKQCFGMTASEYRKFKGIKKGENLRDNMTDIENMLCRDMEILGMTIIRSEDPDGYRELKNVATRVGNFGGQVRQLAETELKMPVISTLSKKDFVALKAEEKKQLESKSSIQIEIAF